MESIKRNIEKKWHVFYVQARHEKKVHQRLLDEGFDSFLPLERKLKQWTQRKKWVEEPLFKSYIFVQIAAHEIMNVLQVPGVVTYVRFAGKPAIIRQRHIDFIRKLLVSETTFEVKQNRFEPGSEIEIETGPFRGMRGIVQEMRGRKKLLVNLEKLDYCIIVELP
jgi:transcription antitermination factor NusG